MVGQSLRNLLWGETKKKCDKSLSEHTNFFSRDVDLKTSTAASFCACEQNIQKFIPALDIRTTVYIRKGSAKKRNKVLYLGL